MSETVPEKIVRHLNEGYIDYVMSSWEDITSIVQKLYMDSGGFYITVAHVYFGGDDIIIFEDAALGCVFLKDDVGQFTLHEYTSSPEQDMELFVENLEFALAIHGTAEGALQDEMVKNTMKFLTIESAEYDSSGVYTLKWDDLFETTTHLYHFPESGQKWVYYMEPEDLDV